MPQAIEMLKTTRATFYRWLRAGKMRGRKVGRQWRFERAEIDRFLRGEQPRIELRADIGPLLKELAKRCAELGAPSVDLPESPPVQQAAKRMVELGVALGASDMHLSPHMVAETGERAAAFLRYRVDGVLHSMARFDIRILPGLCWQWKQMGSVDPEAKHPQDARIVVERRDGKGIVDMRVCYLPTGLGDSLTARFLLRESEPLRLEQIGFAPQDRHRLLRALEKPCGVVLITGPTGSGKTTVLYASLGHVVGENVKAVTIEDPIEYYLPWLVQVGVNEAEGRTFARAGRAALRSDPDVIMVGEVRNTETAMLTLQMALTGHLVFTTLHTDDAAGALVRLVEIGCPAFVVGDATNLVLSQRLVRRLCPACSAPGEPPGEQMARAAEMARRGGFDLASAEKSFRRAVGCKECRQLGYAGRMPIVETLEVGPRIGEALRRGASADEVRCIAVGEGMTTMAADGIRRAAAGETTIEEVLRVLAI